MTDSRGTELLRRLKRHQEVLNKLQHETEKILVSALTDGKLLPDRDTDGLLAALAPVSQNHALSPAPIQPPPGRKPSTLSTANVMMDSYVEIAMASAGYPLESGPSFMSFKSVDAGPGSERRRSRRRSLMDMSNMSGHSVNSMNSLHGSAYQLPGPMKGAASRRPSSLLPVMFRKASMQDSIVIPVKAVEIGDVSGSSISATTSGLQIQSRMSEQESDGKDTHHLTSGNKSQRELSHRNLRTLSHDQVMEDVQEALEVASNISSDDADSTNDSRFQPFRPPGTKFFPNSSLRHPIRKDGFAHIRKLEPPNEVLNQFDEDDQDMAVEVSLKPTELPNSDRNELAICRTASHMTPDDFEEPDSQPRESKASKFSKTSKDSKSIKKTLEPSTPAIKKELPTKPDEDSRQGGLFWAYYLELFHSAMYNEFGERFKGSVQRQFHLLYIAGLSSDEFWGFHPHSEFVVWWEFCSIFFLMSVLIFTPLIVSFDFDANIPLATILISSIMMLDIVRRLYTRKLAGSGTLFTLTSRKSMRLYLRRSLPWDIIGAFPWYFVALRMNNHLGMEFPENFLLVFLFYTRNSIGIFSRNPILQQLARKLQRQLRVGGSFMNVFLFAGLLLLFLHMHACVIFFFGKITRYEPKSWDALRYLLSQPVYSQYTWAFFNSVANTFPVTGYKPSDALEQAATIVAVLIGALLYAALVGTISTFSLGLDTSGRKFKEKIDEVNEFMEERKLSSDVRRRVRKYFKLKYRGKYFDKASILSELNAPLRQEIAIHNLRDLLARVPFLRREQNDGRNDAFVSRVADVLIPEYYIDGDIIFQQGEPGNDMYFIEHGTVDIVVNGNIVGALTDGAFFGEVALLDQSTRSATIKASSHTTLFKLSKRDFQLILEDFQDVEQKMRQVYEERLEKIRKEKEEKERNMVVAACSAQSTVRNPASIPPK